MQKASQIQSPMYRSSRMADEPIDAIIISDIHLGSTICRDKNLLFFLENIVNGSLRTKQLILNGDVFDSIDFRRLKKGHWKILSLIRKLSDEMKIMWVCGNHDGPAESISHLLGVDVREEYSFRSGERSVLVLHGHIFDDFIDTHPRVTFFADLVYRFLQRIDPSHRFARYAKSNSKIFLRCTEKIRAGAIEYARETKHDIVCCGHTHHPEYAMEDTVQYFNNGSWTDVPCTFLSVAGGHVTSHSFEHLEEPYQIFSTRGQILVPSFA